MGGAAVNRALKVMLAEKKTLSGLFFLKNPGGEKGLKIPKKKKKKGVVYTRP